MSRIKPAATAVVIKSTEEADTVLARIAAHKRRIELIDLSAAEEIDEVKARAAAEAEPIKQEIAGLEQSLLRYADYARDELFRGRKSLQLTLGTIGYRLSTKLKTLPKWTFERVLESLKAGNKTEYIRIKEEVDKERLRGAVPELLKQHGLRLVTDDVFFYELSEQKNEQAENI